MSIHRWVLPLLLLLLAFGLRLHRLADLGVQADEGVHLVVGEQLAAGDVLYRDLFENRTPGVEWLLAAVVWMGGDGLLTGRLLSAGAALITVASLIAAGRQAGRDAGGRLAAFLFALAPLPIFWSHFIMLEHFQTAAAALSMACALRGIRRRDWRWWFAAGFVAGLSVLAKHTGLILCGVYGLFIVAQWLGRRKALDGSAAVSVGAGFSLGVLPLVGCLVFQGTAGDFAHLVLGVQRLAPVAGWPEKAGQLLSYVTRQPLIPLACLGAYSALRSKDGALRLVLLWAVAEWIALFLPPETQFSWGGFSHYAIAPIAATSLLVGIGLARAWRAWGGRVRSSELALGGLMTIAALGAVPGCIGDLGYAVQQDAYPMAGFDEEKAIGEAVAAVTREDESLLVLANSAFYHWAGRHPASRYFHYPGFLPTSSLATESEAALRDALSSAETGAVLISRLHLDGRLPERVVEALWENWIPAAIFPYSYQRDVFLFLPRPNLAAKGAASAEFENGIRLLTIDAEQLCPTSMLVRLQWTVDTRPAEDYTVSVHLLGPDGTLVAQHDGVPVVGFRPTTTWADGERVTDWHWLKLPAGCLEGIYQIWVRLYRPGSGERLLLQGEAAGTEAFVKEIRIRP
jgi:hypothetical protein